MRGAGKPIHQHPRALPAVFEHKTARIVPPTHLNAICACDILPYHWPLSRHWCAWMFALWTHVPWLQVSDRRTAALFGPDQHIPYLSIARYSRPEYIGMANGSFTSKLSGVLCSTCKGRLYFISNYNTAHRQWTHLLSLTKSVWATHAAILCVLTKADAGRIKTL